MPSTYARFMPAATILIAAFTYFLAGKYGLLLAIPPGFASAVWPASGVALAAMLLHPKYYTCIGIGLGSFAVNLGVTSSGYSGMTLDQLILPACIACGASLQAYFGYWLFNLALTSTRFDNPSSILRFTLFVCPLSCLVAASVGTCSLYVIDIIHATNMPFTWLTWWAGDTIGTLLFAPLLLILFSRHTRFTSMRKWQIAIPTVAIFLSITTLFHFSTVSQKNSVQREIDDAARTFAQNLNERLTISEGKLQAYIAFFNSASVITAMDFEVFSKHILKDDDVFQGIGWTPIVSADKRALFEALAREQVSPDFAFKDFNTNGELSDAIEEAYYYPVFYIYPLDSNKRALGLNLSSLPGRLPLLLKVASNKRALATAPITLIQGERKQKGIILYLPIYSATPLLDTNPDIAATGFISGVFQMDGVMHALARAAKAKHYGLHLIDVTEKESPSTLFETDNPPLTGFLPVTLPLDFGGRQFSLTSFVDSEFKLNTRDWTSWSILTFGFLLAALFQAFILLITGTTENIKTEVERQTIELSRAKNSAEKANRAKTNFLNNMSHELRTPLNAVMGFIGLTLKTPLSEIQQSHLSKAQLASSTLMSLINHTLDYSKIESGLIELEKIDFKLSDIASKLSAIFSSLASERGIFFQLVVEESVPNALIGDPLRLEQILINLCNNAIKFTNTGGVTLKVTSETIDEQYVELTFKVIDSGIGIKADQQDKLFEAFSQAEVGTKRLYGGTGLGLSICKKLVDVMKGSIALKSQVDIGTEITVLLCFKVNPETHQAGMETSSNEHSDEELLADLNVLLVEDVAINQELATYILEDFGAHVFTVNNGQEAIDFLNNGQVIDVILMDLQMPVMGGIEATQKIVANPATRPIPIIAMTANAISTDVNACFDAGMRDHIAKPIDENDLLQKIIKHCKRKAS